MQLFFGGPQASGILHFIVVKMPEQSDEETTEQQFRNRFQKTREDLALLAAVDHVDYNAEITSASTVVLLSLQSHD